MAKGAYEFLVFMNRFTNIDIFCQGIYYIQLRCHYGDVAVSPVMIEHQSAFPYGEHPHRLEGPSVQYKSNAISSRLFLIRYSEETVILNESGVFRVEVESAEDFELEVTLCFFPIDKKTKVFQVFKLLTQDLAFREVAKARFKIKNLFDGVNQFLPVKFTGINASVLNCSIHGSLLNYKSLDKVKINAAEQSYTYLKPLVSCFNSMQRLLKQIIETYQIPGVDLPPSIAMHDSSSCKHLVEEINEYASKIFEIRFLLSKILEKYPRELLKSLENVYHASMRTRWGENIYSEKKPPNCPIKSDKHLKKTHRIIAKKTRKSQYFRSIDSLPIEDLKVFEDFSTAPLVFEEIYSKTPLFNDWNPECFSLYTEHTSIHLFVMVHGYLGKCLDLKLLKDTISSLQPSAVFLMSKANEGKSNNDIQEMGKELANEVIRFVSGNFDEFHLTHMSFIGFSLGGIIVRAALPYLYEHKDKMKSFISLNSPHLGCPSGDSLLVDAGRWLVMKVKKSFCLKQLSFSDHKDVTKSFLYKLSHTVGIEWFKYFILVSSSQDKLVPFESARIECGNHISGKHLVHMSECLLGRLEKTKLIRVDCNFGKKKMGKIVGRKAHVKVLESIALQNLLVYRYADAFSTEL